MNKICIIPARMGSSRFPGKPLKNIKGMPLIIHIAKRCLLSKKIDKVVVATCDNEIKSMVANYDIDVVMTRDDHDRCTDRVSEAINYLSLELKLNDLIIMVQGDEILVDPVMIDMMIDTYEKIEPPAMNIVSRLYNEDDYASSDVVKAVGAPDGRALYMSRSAIPSPYRHEDVSLYQQTGIIAFSVDFLRKFGEMEQTPLEIIESIDMLRAIENGIRLQLLYIEQETIGVDTEADLLRAEKMLNHDEYLDSYL